MNLAAPRGAAARTVGLRLHFGPLVRQRIVREALGALDLIVVAGCFALYAALREGAPFPLGPLGLFAIVLVLAIWHAVFRALGLYPGAPIVLRPEGWRLAAAAVFAVATGALTAHVADFSVSAQALLIGAPSVGIALALGRASFARLLSLALRSPRRLQRVLVIGSGHAALDFAERIRSIPELGFEVVGFVDDHWRGLEAFRNLGQHLVSDLKNAPDFLREEVVDDVVIAAPLSAVGEHMGPLLQACRSLGIHVRILGSAFDHLHAALPDLEDETALVISASASISDQWSLVAKRAFDIVASSALLIATSPLLAGTALLIALSSPGPVFFVQERLGLRRRRFEMFKFRTMRDGAEREVAKLEDRNQVDGAVFKIGDDPRLTPIGKWLRRFSIDELPQLWNVFRGDMSLVGPRPLPVRDYLRFEELPHLRRFSVRPGLTGLWQISGRSTLSFERWIELDLRYIDEWSLALDVKILAKTPAAVVSGRGAY